MSDDDETRNGDASGALTPQGGGSLFAAGVPPWREQDMLLRDLWVQKKPPQEIADALGRSVAAVMTRAARLGLPRRLAPGRKPGSRRASLPGAPRRASRRRSMEPSEGVDSSKTPLTRICLMCLRSFPSMGRHNRICPSCRRSAEYVAAQALSDNEFPL